MDVLLEETVEVLNEAISKERRDCADLGRRKYAEQQSRESEADLDLKLGQRSFRCTHRTKARSNVRISSSEFTRDGTGSRSCTFPVRGQG